MAKEANPMNFHGALRVIRDVIKMNPDVNLVNEGANTLDYCRAIVDMYKPRKRLTLVLGALWVSVWAMRLVLL